MTSETFLDAREKLTDELRRLQEEYLRLNGWRHSCNHPGGLWLWEKGYDMQTYNCNADTAVALQLAMEQEQ